MSEIAVTFIHPTDGRHLDVEIDDEMTGAEVVSELIANQFVPPSPEGYQLAVKGGSNIILDSPLKVSGVSTGAKIRVLPATDAGSDVGS